MKETLRSLRLLSLITSVIWVVHVYAEGPATIGDKAAESASPWTASAEVGFISTSGDTETRSFSGKVDIVYEIDKWRHSGRAEGYVNESKDDQGATRTDAEAAMTLVFTY